MDVIPGRKTKLRALWMKWVDFKCFTNHKRISAPIFFHHLLLLNIWNKRLFLLFSSPIVCNNNLCILSANARKEKKMSFASSACQKVCTRQKGFDNQLSLTSQRVLYFLQEVFVFLVHDTMDFWPSVTTRGTNCLFGVINLNQCPQMWLCVVRLCVQLVLRGWWCGEGMEAPEYLDLDEIDFSDDAVVGFFPQTILHLFFLTVNVCVWNLQNKMCVHQGFPQVFSPQSSHLLIFTSLSASSPLSADGINSTLNITALHSCRTAVCN